MTNQLNLGRAYSLASSNYSYIDCVKCQISLHLIRGVGGGELLCFYCELLLRPNLTMYMLQFKIMFRLKFFNLGRFSIWLSLPAPIIYEL